MQIECIASSLLERFAEMQLIFCKDNANERRISSLLEYSAECSLSFAKIQKISINAIVMNEKVLILLNTTILTENTELGDEGGVKIKKADEVSSADGCDGLGGCSHNPVAENLSYNKIYLIKLLSQKK